MGGAVAAGAGSSPGEIGAGASGCAARLAAALWVLCAALVLSSLLLDYLTPGFLTPPERPGPLLATSTALLSLACPTVGAVVASRLPANPVGWIFCGMGLIYGARRLAVAYADQALLVRPGLPAGEYAAWVSAWLGFPGLVALGVFLALLFPDGRLPARPRPPSRLWRAVAWAAVSGAALIGAGEALRPGPLTAYYYVRNPLGAGGPAGGTARTILEAAGAAGGVLLLAGCLACVAAPFVRLRGAGGGTGGRHGGRDERRQIGWFISAAVPAVVGASVLLVDWTAERLSLLFAGTAVRPVLWVAESLGLFVREDRDLGPLAELRLETNFEFLAVLALFFVPIFTSVAILRHRLYGVDAVVNRTLVYGALTTVVVALYVGLVAVFGALFRVGTGGNLIASLLATGFVAALFQPLRHRLQRAVDRLMYGERHDPYAAVSRLGRRLEATLAPEAVPSTIVETVAGALKVPHAAMELKNGDGFKTVAVHDTAVRAAARPSADPPAVVPLVHRGEPIGRLILSPRSPNEPFSAADRRLLGDLARQAEAAVHAAQLTADLRRSREELVAAREEERRRLRRDLHDGVGSTLAGLALGLDAARRVAGRDPEGAQDLLRRLESQTQDAVADIRRLVHGLRPPALDDLGLVPAIRQQADSYGFAEKGAANETADGTTTFSLDVPRDPPVLPAAVEVAAFRIAQEALANVARHARARSCRLRLSVDRPSGALELEVSDNGVGLPGSARGPAGPPQPPQPPRGRGAGVGLSSMRERAEELGGTCVVEPAPTGGTRVLARLPVEASNVRPQESGKSAREPAPGGGADPDRGPVPEGETPASRAGEAGPDA